MMVTRPIITFAHTGAKWGRERGEGEPALRKHICERHEQPGRHQHHQGLLGHQGHQHHQGHKGHQGLMGHQGLVGHQSELKRHVGPEDPIKGHLAEQQELERQLGA